MSLLRCLHEKWAAHRPLAERIPPQRVVTGLALGGLEAPYATVTRRPDQSVTRTSSGHRLRVAVVAWSICDADLEAAAHVAEVLDGLLHRAEFDYAEGRVLDARLLARSAEAAGDGMWRVSLEYLMTLDEP